MAASVLGRRTLERGLATARSMSWVLPWVVGAVFLYVMPTRLDRLGLFTLTEILILAVFATSLNLLLGYARLVSFGHAAYFGVGAYIVGISLQRLDWMNIPLAVLLAFVGAGAVAAIIGFFCVRRDDIYFAMLTLAFGQVIQLIVLRFDDYTGGSEGLTGGIPRPPFSLGFVDVDLGSPLSFYYAAAFITFVSLALMRLIIASPFGYGLRAAGADRMRAEASGINVRGHRLAAFIIAGAFAGVAGGLYGMFQLAAYPEMLDWTMSGHILIMVLVGGMAYYFGPLVGTVVIIMLRFYLPGITEHPGLVLGILLVAVVLGFRGGALGTAVEGARYVWRFLTPRVPWLQR